MAKESFKQASAEFRQHLPDLSIPRFTTAKEQNAYEYAAAFKKTHIPPWFFNLTEAWRELLEEPYLGVTNDGKIREDIFEAQDAGINVQTMCNAADSVLQKLSQQQREQVQYPLNAKEWRAWSNPELLLRPFGLRLEDLPEELAIGILGVVEATFSPEGYQKALAAMRINHFLGEVCKVPRIMNKYSYNFLLFGQPSSTEPWGWSMYGHHLCLTVFLKGGHITISPTFTGAEPDVIDMGEFAGTQILHTEGELGLKLMQSLPPTSQDAAQTYKLLHDPRMLQTGDLKVDRWNQDDQRHLCGAFRDNRIVPYEGVKVGSMNAAQQSLILEAVDQFVLYLPSKARKLRLQQVQRHFDETFFSWIGGFGDTDAYYYRIQSPVIICEFDHHSGVYLTNKEPAKFHIHTIVRTPNGGDYGNALREKWERLK
ncbi:hypothetical protein K431DRAFT_251082 [Polychaeton citri CBS 116435]|uniref:DUF3500 domain-containing protein n=1 Tax=Polychaeton citri CBS 116435 TaxID=1314669 RepID=A0A9P4Q2S2_9PEZI|nr:hypothetical protein K431DRAFT_251082 [Polychaeton citri CBS 116435]